MAVFTEKDEDSLDYYILRDHPVCIYSNSDRLEHDIKWLQSQHYKIYRVNAENSDSFVDQLGLIISEHHSEGQWSGGVDSLNDYVFDFDVPDEGGVVFYFQNFEKMYEEDEHFSNTVLDIMASHSRQKSLLGRRMITLLLLKPVFDMKTHIHHKISSQIIGGFKPGFHLKRDDDWHPPEIPVFSAKNATPEELEIFLNNLRKKS